jgi:hypothetical protein
MPFTGTLMARRRHGRFNQDWMHFIRHGALRFRIDGNVGFAPGGRGTRQQRSCGALP